MRRYFGISSADIVKNVKTLTGTSQDGHKSVVEIPEYVEK